ncbi:MAG: hypothetical protein WBF49_04065, partial [Methyloceanibacter sp.]
AQRQGHQLGLVCRRTIWSKSSVILTFDENGGPIGELNELKLIELRFGLECLGDRDKKSKDLTNAFDFDGPPPEPVCKP